MATIRSEGFANFCKTRPGDDNRDRMVCSDCGWIHYENPRIIVGAVVTWQDQILFCRRAIRPRYGFWTVPGGFMELGESPEEGAQREVLEESGAAVRIQQLLGVYSVPRIGQVHMMYLAEMTEYGFRASEESLESSLFPARRDCIPWEELAFPVNHWVLRDFLSLEGRPVTQPFTVRPEDLQQRMSKVDYHPNYPPPDVSVA